MSLISAIFVAVLFTGGTYMMLRRSFFEVLIGIAMMSHGTNVLLIAISGWRHSGRAPIATEGLALTGYVDPLPQALILTAIVIGFGVTAFVMAMTVRAWRQNRDIEITELGHDEEPFEDPDSAEPGDAQPEAAH